MKRWKRALRGTEWEDHMLITHHPNIVARSVAAILLGAPLIASSAPAGAI
uniref:Uncharacterized protein n=1 Tax=Rhizobium rhizogenes TaxID=359 RepID=A0A7S5DQW7_RHIRH|nr:hypothetical protein pC5.8b_373 [Rhizobium rhizogenes]